MMRSRTVRFLASLAIVGAALAVHAAAPPTAIIEKPKPRTVTTGSCRILSDGTLSGTWGPADLPTLAFTIGPGAAMADQMHANKAKFAGPGKYQNEILAIYLGKTALEDSYGGLGTIVVNADGHSGTFTTNDSKAAGRFDCGVVPR
jgi:hypothetical protein